MVNDLVAYSPKACSDESKPVELKQELVKLYTDLKEVKQEKQLTENTWLLSQVIQKMPVQFKKELSKLKAVKLAEDHSLWETTSTYLKDEAKRFDQDLP